MRKFIISDIHGFGNLYYPIMSYLDKINKEEDIELYINGDLIDRGNESVEILLDIKKRIEENKYKIVYLGGNHELMMYKVFKRRKKGLIVSPLCDWYFNGGHKTDDVLEEKVKNNEMTQDDVLEIGDFISNLKIYHVFQEKVADKPILLVHAASPLHVVNPCNFQIKNNNGIVFYTTWTREINPIIPYKCRIGHKNYFTIIGHTPNSNPLGYDYYKNGNYLNIDGGCAGYVEGYTSYNHFPLVEVCDGYLKILTFNCNNEIIYANYFDGDKSLAFNTNEINEARKYLDSNVKIKKLKD